MSKELKTITLEDNQEYVILDEIAGNNKYFYLINAKDDSIFLIRKEIVEDGNKYLKNLDTDQEFNEALNLYVKKNA